MKPTDTATARFYGLPKEHKANFPLRPIVSIRGTPTYGLAKWMIGRLKFLAEGSSTTLTSAYHFLERIKHLKLEPDESMVYFDVVSLFTSIPQQLAIDAVDQLLAERYEDRDKTLKSEHLLELLRYCLKTYFTFGGQMYEQIKGTPMGSSISSLITEVVLQRLEHLVFTKYQPKFWARFVDDTFAVVKTIDIEHLKELLNSVNPDIQITMEAETNNQLPFLDVLVRRCTTGQLETTVFRKSTNTRQILHFNSNHPLSHKRSFVRTLFQRVETHCSTPEDKRAVRLCLVNLFTANGYPRHFTERSRRWAPRQRPNEQQPEVWRAIPYVKGVSEAVSRLLQPTRVGIAHRPQATIRRRLMQLEDPLSPAETSAVIYKINCNEGDCNYVGETGRKLQTRLQEHKSATRRCNNSDRQTHGETPRYSFGPILWPPKVHKEGAPLPPIVSLKATPTYGLTNWLFWRLKFLTAESETTVSLSAELLEKLKGGLALKTIELLLQSKYDKKENRLGHAQVLRLLNFRLRNYFTFDETIYEQVQGTPMSSSIPVYIAEAVLQRLESLVFQHHKPKFCVLNEDDTFAVIDRGHLMTFKEHLNAVFSDGGGRE
nr:unnamed protein product [Spirometra erinaceieuropaei]